MTSPVVGTPWSSRPVTPAACLHRRRTQTPERCSLAPFPAMSSCSWSWGHLRNTSLVPLTRSPAEYSTSRLTKTSGHMAFPQFYARGTQRERAVCTGHTSLREDSHLGLVAEKHGRSRLGSPENSEQSVSLPFISRSPFVSSLLNGFYCMVLRVK